MPWVICYHGTDADAAAQIRKEGFRPLTYFARHLEDAVGFGGEYVFEVVFDADELHANAWQFRLPQRIEVDRIVACTRMMSENIFENEKLRKRISDSWERPGWPARIESGHD
jgi:hypothetical protein